MPERWILYMNISKEEWKAINSFLVEHKIPYTSHYDSRDVQGTSVQDKYIQVNLVIPDYFEEATQGDEDMRDINRIMPFCGELAALWMKYPDLRFGQFMSNITKYIQRECKKDIFYMEDAELMEIIRDQLK